MAIISKITWKNRDFEVIDDIDINSKYVWLNEKHIETKIGYLNLPAVTNRYDLKYKKCEFKLIDEPKYQPFRWFIHNDLAKNLIKTPKTDKIDAFRKKLRFNVRDLLKDKEQLVIKLIKDPFEGGDMQT